MAHSGLVLVDKPAGWTSHDVVARTRRLAGTRRVGHAGTLDPMATGVLVLGVERATKLLGHLATREKSYAATIRLGASTVTDDAEGEVVRTAAAGALDAVTADAVRAGLAALTGELRQVPSAVSAVEVAGKRAYARVRAGETVALAARPVTVSRLDLLALRRGETGAAGRTGEAGEAGEAGGASGAGGAGVLDADVVVECSSGTYVRALARDLGEALGVGGHLTALRRTSVGPFTIDACRTLDELAAADDPVMVPLDRAVADGFARRDLSAVEAGALAHGRPLRSAGIAGTYGAFDPDGRVVALLEERNGAARPVVVLRPA